MALSPRFGLRAAAFSKLAAVVLFLGASLPSARGQIAISNATTRVNFNPATGYFSLLDLASGRSFVQQGNFSETNGAAATTAVTNATFGQGQAIQFSHADGSSDAIMLFSNVPFALFQSALYNGGAQTVTSNKIHTLTALVNLNESAGSLAALGTGGLTTPAGNPGSYSWLAVADPQSRNGVVSGWLTTDRGSGIVFGKTNGSLVEVDAQIDYGRLQFLPGQTNVLEIFGMGYFSDARAGLETWASCVAQIYNIQLPPQPDGLCTYPMDQHGGASTPAAVAQLSDFVKTNLEAFGFSMIQFDAGWQAGITTNGPTRIFTEYTNAYSAGVKPTADYELADGVTPGIWLEAFAGTYYDPYFTNHLDWFVQTANGAPYVANWGGTCFDMTYQPARTYVSNMISQITTGWDYQYLKMDGLWTGSATPLKYVNASYVNDGMGDAVFSNPAKPNIEAFRDGLRLVRQAAGTNIFLDGCNIAQNMRSYSGSFGLLDGIRIGPDNSSSWGSASGTGSGWLRSPLFGSRHYFLQGRVWYNDPDTAYVRASFPLNEAQEVVSWYAISGQLFLDGDWIPGLAADRLDLLKRALPHHGLLPRPVDYFENDPPNIWLLTDSRRSPQRNVVGLFNWSASSTLNVNVTLAHLGLATNIAYVGFDYWSNALIANISGNLTMAVQPASVEIIAVRPQSGVPELISTSRHVTQGVVDVLAENWDGTNTLSGASQLVGGDSYELRICSTNNWRVQSAGVSAADQSAGVTVSSFTQSDSLARVTLLSPANRQVSWSVVFTEAPQVALTSPTNNQVLYTNSVVLLSASASDPLGSIAKVDFYNGGSDIGTVSNAPYNLAISNLAVGPYNFSAVATDNNGLSATSAVVQVQVRLFIPFTLTANPPSLTLTPGGKTNCSVTVTDTNNFSGVVALSLGGLPPQAAASFNPASVNGSGVTTLTVTASNGIAAGGYNLTVIGSSGLLTNTAAVPFLVYTTSTNLQWNPVSNGAWDVGATANWYNQGSGLNVAYQQGAGVLFNDGGGAYPTVTLATGVAVQPAWVVVNADVINYSISGAGRISGSTGIEKDGGSTLTLSATNDCTGPITNNDGTLVLNTVASASSINVASGATFQLNANYTTLTLTGNGVWNVNAGNGGGGVSYNITGNVSNFTGATYIPWGVRYWVGSQNSMPGGTMYVTNGGQFGISHAGVLSGNLHIEGMTWGGSPEYDGALRLNAGTGSGGVFAGTLTLDADSAVAAGITGGSGTVSANIGGNHMLTLINGVVTFSGNNAFGSFYVTNGSTAVAGSSTAFGGGGLVANGTNEINGFNLSVANLSGTGIVGNYHASNVSKLTVGTDNTSTLYAGTLINGSTAPLALTKTGSGTLTLGGMNSFSGSTTVSNGALMVIGSLSGTGSVYVATAGTLAGKGTVAGPVTVDGALAPGTNSIGMLTLSNNLTLNGDSRTMMEVSKSPTTNDVAQVAGAVTYGGTLNVTNITTNALAAGDSFKLFNAGSFSGSFTSIAPASPGVGLAWNTNGLTNGTLAVVVWDFGIGATPVSRATAVGGSVSYTVTLTPTNGFSSNVVLSASGLPAGVGVGFNPNPISGANSTILTLTVSNGVAAGNLPFTITGASGALMHSTNVSLSVNDFTVASAPSSQAVQVGGVTNFTVTIGAINGFNGTVALTVSGLPAGSSYSLSPTNVVGSGVSTLALTTSNSIVAGNYPLTITGASGSLTHTGAVTLSVNDFTLAASPASQAVQVGGGTNYTITVGAGNGFGGTVTLSVNGLPAGSSYSLSPTNVVGAGVSTLTVTTSNNFAAGNYPLTITGVCGSLTHTGAVTLSANDFTVAATPVSQAVYAGGDANYNVTIGSSNGFGGSVALSVSGAPPQAAYNLSATNILAPGASTLSVSTSTNSPIGSYPLLISGQCGGLTRTANLTLVVKVPPVNLLWDGASNGIWDVGLTTNWLNLDLDQEAVFAQGNFVFFDDSTGVVTNVVLGAGVAVQPGVMTIATSTNSFSFSGAGKISGPGALVKTGTSQMTLSTTNDFTGGTLVSAGTLALIGGGSLDGSAAICIAAGAVLDVSGRVDGSLTLANGQTLSGQGEIIGSLVANPGSSLSTASNGVGALSVSGAVDLGGMLWFKLDAQNGTNDLIAAGSIAYGGTLNLSNVNGAPVAGQSFKLFVATNYSGNFSNLVPPMAGQGLTWDASGLTDGVVRVVWAPRPSIWVMQASGSNVIIWGSNGVAAAGYYVLASTNVALPLSNWSIMQTGWFDSSGNLVVTNPTATNSPRQFFLLQAP